jgi:ElaA protein
VTDRAVRDAGLDALHPATLYRILALRTEVFVVEQDCVYQDLDGRDLEPSARQLWIEDDGEVLATLRILTDEDGRRRIGRVVTAPTSRGAGLAALLMQRALEIVGDAPAVLEAQSHLVDWYARFGFVVAGPEYLEDGIAHTTMTRAAPSA